MKRSVVFVLLCFILSAPGASAIEMAPNLENQVRELSQKVAELALIVQDQQKEIRVLKEAREPSLDPPQQAPVLSASIVPGRFNPEIGVVADIVAKFDSPKEDTEGADRVSVREVELVIGSNVDPYSRFDSTIAFSDFEEASLEEAYLTRFDLPLDLTARVGKFKPRVGKAIPVHRDSLETIDEPLVIQRYFGLEGYNKAGVDVTRMIELPWPVTHQISLGVLEGGNGEDGTAFGETRRRPTLYSHLKNYIDVTDVTGLEVGLSHMIGSKDMDANFEVQILAGDVTLIHHFNANQNLKMQGEVFYMNREETSVDLDGTLLGAYALADLRFHPQWSTGFRFDTVEIVDNPLENPNNKDRGYTGYLTFYQSEFARWRVQFTHTDMADGRDNNQVILQGTFAIGEHKHKLQ